MVRFRKGDLVSIKATVRYDQHADETVFLDLGSGVAVAPDKVTMIAPRFDVGEFVAIGDGHGNELGGHVKAICEAMVWVKHPNGYATYEACKVRRLDPPEPEAVDLPMPTLPEKIEIPPSPTDPPTVDAIEIPF